ncbi:PorT family protein [Hymenobacter sp. 15J16-1T3B]|uniref:porin family protein n=1 Tax=Hymenobacter sp. 15J16-1T3B TaxID=2886941 RepID=UPI001D12A754|nr:porin family protein [Hymenobacter sp. 15J16-1T3B]MCC3156610.1 PorT family protein [Hymenobacter sp. 15J16-1T3B]
MKKIALILSLCALCGGSAFAQRGVEGIRKSSDYQTTPDSRNNGFGLKGGWNASTIRGAEQKNYSDLSARNNFHAGAYAQFGFSPQTSLQVEALYSRQGYKAASQYRTTSAGAPNTAKYETQLDYVQVPVMFVYNFVDNVSFHVGPQVSLLVNAKENKNSVNLSDRNYNSLDYGAVGGIEARVGPARIGGRYVLSLGDIYNDPKMENGVMTPDSRIDNIKNSVIQVYVGFGFSQ